MDSYQELRWGTRLRDWDGRVVEGLDRHGTRAFVLEWSGERITGARVRLPDRRWVRIDRAIGELPEWGSCDGVLLEGEEEHRARYQTLDLNDPDRIPPLDTPARLPPGAGSAIINLIALRTRRESLRYCGPYPTGVLFDTLLQSFRLEREPQEAFGAFNAGVEQLACSGELREIPLDFVPAPHERLWLANDVCVQLRDGVEKVFLAGKTYTPHPTSLRRIRFEGQEAVLCWWVAGAAWVDLLRLDARGEVVSGPHPFPPTPARYLDEPLPEPTVQAVGQALSTRAPTLLRAALGEVFARGIRWGDPGADLGGVDETGRLMLHAGLAEHLEDATPGQAFNTFALALEPLAHRLAQRTLLDQQP